ncbi:FwdC/FmdC family protein [Mycolicibacterium conceptionense]|uniref:FwdC/FmdC family protein n=1 Tax=Mycolicibacterium conceptionense TaxID=451644 RepID=A0A0U1DU63_9MYCO|nr:FwdC/FmdC family protein [Mycolicibacterium conceptionense]
MDQIAATLVGYDLRTTPLRDVNAALHQPGVEGEYVIAHPDGAHNVAVGLNAPIRVTVEGHVATTPPG